MQDMTYPVTPEAATAPACYRHPGVEAAVRCRRCERPICPDCMIEAPVGFQCPECVTNAARTSPQVRWRPGTPSRSTRRGVDATVVILAVNVVLFVLSLAPQSRQWLLEHGSNVPGLVVEGEWWRLATSMFLHFEFFHIAFNMYALWVLGRDTEGVLGLGWFLVLYFASGIAGGALYVLLAPTWAPAIGASGAIFGLFGVVAALAVARRGSPAGRMLFQQVGVLLAVNLLITFVIPGIAWQAHVGGLVAGGGLAWVCDHTRNAWARWGVVAVVLGAAAAMILQRAATLGL